VLLYTEDSGLNWNWILQSGSTLATYVALMGAYLAGFSPLEFALCSAVLLGLCLTLFYLATTQNLPGNTAQNLDSNLDSMVSSSPNVPSLSESMVELHTLQSEINAIRS